MSISLLRRIAVGDSQAAVSFYKLYSPKILLFLSKRLPSIEDAQEINNDVFLEAMDSIALLKEESNLRAWLYKIAHNKIVDYYRKRKIKSILLSQMPFLQIVAAEINQPEFQFEKNKIRDRIELVMLSIPSQYQKILKLRYEEDYSVKQIAQSLKTSFKSAESLLFRARKSFMLAFNSSESVKYY